MTIFPFKVTYIKGRKRSRVRPVLWNIFAVVAIAAMVLGPFYLASELFGTPTPSARQIREARAIICAAILAPFAILIARMMWQSRGAERTWVRRRMDTRLKDSSKRWEIESE